jgi:hypothetical protein
MIALASGLRVYLACGITVSVAGTARPILLDGVAPPPRPGIFGYAG